MYKKSKVSPILHCTTLHCTAMHCTALHDTITHSTECFIPILLSFSSFLRHNFLNSYLLHLHLMSRSPSVPHDRTETVHRQSGCSSSRSSPTRPIPSCPIYRAVLHCTVLKYLPSLSLSVSPSDSNTMFSLPLSYGISKENLRNDSEVHRQQELLVTTQPRRPEQPSLLPATAQVPLR